MILSIKERIKNFVFYVTYEIYTRTKFNLQQLNILFMIIRARMKRKLSRVTAARCVISCFI